MSSLSTPASHAATPSNGEPLLVLLDPAAKQTDGESVRIAKDVLCGGADAKVAHPESPSELDRVLSHRGRRRPVVIGSDLALQRVLQALHRQRELGSDPVGLIPVGRAPELSAARALGVPAEPVQAARAVLTGVPRELDLLVDDGGGVVLGELRISGAGGRRGMGRMGGWRSLWAKLAAAEQATAMPSEGGEHTEARLRVEADGRLLADVHRPVRVVQISLPLGEGAMEIVVRAPGALVRGRATSVTVNGRGFAYEADGHPSGPVRSRTWTVHAGAWRLLLPPTG
ncbi:diacylglycerol kinase [Kitasatospora sp. NBC_00315]|uniref:diacylglycerol kinase n=1 Tax=Kitasatospora sp. NBC_00315 TaxID=2975963 RepID=UPI0032519871